MFRATKTVPITEKERERDDIIYVWKIIEGLVPNISDPITCSFSGRRGRACVVCHSGAGRLGTLKYNSFRWRSIRMFNRLPNAICMLPSCSVVGFKSKLDSYSISPPQQISPTTHDPSPVSKSQVPTNPHTLQPPPHNDQ